MPATDLTVQDISRDGLDMTTELADELNGNSFTNDGDIYLYLYEVSEGDNPLVVTVHEQHPCSYGYDHDITLAMVATDVRLLGPFPRGRFNDGNGKVQVSYSSVGDLQIAAVRLPET